MTRRMWTEAERELLRQRYADTKTCDLAQALGRELKHVYAAADRLGLRKSDAFLATEASGRLQRLGHRCVEHQFKPGHTTWNKGKKGSTGLHANTAAHHFAKRHKPHTWHRWALYVWSMAGWNERSTTPPGRATCAGRPCRAWCGKPSMGPCPPATW